MKQTDFARETGLPRWGCMILAFIVVAWRTATGQDPSPELVLRVLEDALSRPAKWSAGRTVVTCAGEAGGWELVLWDPTALVQIALSYAGGGWTGAQYPDRRTVHPEYVSKWSGIADVVPDVPRNHVGLSATLVNYRRPSSDGHWVACDAQGLSVIYDPDPSLGIDGWLRTGAWRGVMVWRT